MNVLLLIGLIACFGSSEQVATAQEQRSILYRPTAINYDQISRSAIFESLRNNKGFAISKIPHLAKYREEYYQAAVDCVLKYGHSPQNEILARNMNDQTVRLTISTENDGMTIEACKSELGETGERFNQLVRKVLYRVAEEMQGEKKSYLLTDRKVIKKSFPAFVKEATRLNHFHAYFSNYSKVEDENEVALPLHTDAGLMIAMATPMFFDLKSAKPLEEQPTSTGLFVELSNDLVGKVQLKDDELFFMVGEGFTSWFQHEDEELQRVKPVMHGMKMESDQNLIRAWFGMMVLGPKEDTMANTGLTFEEFTRRTTRYLLDSENTDFGAVACPRGRVLRASDLSCTFRVCHPKPNSPLSSHACTRACNMKHSAEEEECKRHCSCTGSIANGGRVCWMLCVKNCPNTNGQRCNNQALICPRRLLPEFQGMSGSP